MANVRHIITAFLAGEIDPLLSGRVDTNHYALGLKTCENFVPINEGPLVKRPGFEYICDADASSVWLGAFRFSITQEYVIEWGEAKARFYTNGGRIETSPGVAYEVVTPYVAAHVPQLSCQQSYDRLYIDHASYPPAALARTGAATFSHASLTLKNGPFLDQNSDEAVTVTASAVTVGAGVTVSASAAMFAAGDVGSLLRIEAKDFSTIKAWEAGMDAIVVGEVVRSDGKAYKALSGTKTGTIPPTHDAGAEWDGQGKNDVLNAKGPYAVQWEYLHGRYGTVRITGFTDAQTVTGTVEKRLPDQLLSVATHRWSHSAFSATRGWPSLVCHAWGRQVHFKGLDVIGSVAGDFGGGQVNFQTLTSSGILAADLGFRRTIATENPPLWVVADRELLVGTANKELKIGAINAQQAVAGDNIKTDPQSFYGSEPVFPLQTGTQAIFIERGGRRIRSAGYDFGSDRYVPVDMTAAARHVTRGEVKQLAYQRIPHALIYAVRGDGQLVAHPETKLEIKGFARMIMGGAAKVLSAVAVVGADGKHDELWLLVERSRADGLKREIWKQAGWRDIGDDQREAFFVDCGTRADAAGGQVHFSGAVHLAGQAIAVLAGGGVVPGITVAADGSFELPATSVPTTPYTLIFGLPYTATVVTLPPNVQVNGKSSHGLRQRLVKAAARLLETLGLKAGSGTADDPLEPMIDRPFSAAMDGPVPLFTGDTQGDIDASFGRNGQATFVSDTPLPAVVTMAMLTLAMDGNDV